MKRNPALHFDQFEVLTFDCYGTLIDWETGILKSVNAALAAHGISPDGNGLLTLYAKLEAEAEARDYQPYRRVLARVMQGIGAHFNVQFTTLEIGSLADSVGSWLPFPDTVDALKKLQAKYQLAIISNTDDDIFAATSRLLQVPFDFVTTAQQARSYKPALNNFQVALAKIGKPKEKILHVAESIFHDVVPAKSLGWNTVWVNRRVGKTGSGATKAAQGSPDMELLDIKSLAELAV